MGLLTKYVLFAQLIVLILFILPVLVLAKQVPADSIYISYPLAIINIVLIIVVEIIIYQVYQRKSNIMWISKKIKESANEGMIMQMNEQNRMNHTNNQLGYANFNQGMMPKFLNNWVAPSQSLESIQITPGLINQINGLIDSVTRDIIRQV